jgi:hypothetical protein
MTNEQSHVQAKRLNVWRVAGWGLAALLFLLPVVAMQFTTEIAWTGSDFLFAAVLIGGSGLMIELGVRSMRGNTYNAALGLTVLTTFLLVWINAAVGIIGNEDNPLNLLYGIVAATILVGAMIARLRAVAMARTFAVAASVQAVIGMIAVVAGADQSPGQSGLALINGMFFALLVGAAWLFRHAARERVSASRA